MEIDAKKKNIKHSVTSNVWRVMRQLKEPNEGKTHICLECLKSVLIANDSIWKTVDEIKHDVPVPFLIKDTLYGTTTTTYGSSNASKHITKCHTDTSIASTDSAVKRRESLGSDKVNTALREPATNVLTAGKFSHEQILRMNYQLMCISLYADWKLPKNWTRNPLILKLVDTIARW